MKRLMQISLTAILLLLLNGCNPSTLVNMNNEQLDPNLPKLDTVRAIPSNTSVAFEWQPMANKGVQGYNIYRTPTNQYVNSPTKELEKIAPYTIVLLHTMLIQVYNRTALILILLQH